MHDGPEFPPDAGPLDTSFRAVQSPIVGECRHCQAPIRSLHMDRHCPQCGKLLPGAVPAPKAPWMYPETAKLFLIVGAITAAILWLLSFGQR